jgi:hypothetical protein
MSTPIDDTGRYRIVMPYDIAGQWCGYFASWDYQTSPGRIVVRKLSVMDTPAGRRFDGWWRAVSPRTQPQTMVIERLDGTNRLAERWSILNAIPVRFLVATSGSGKDLAAETLEIAHQGLKRIQ